MANSLAQRMLPAHAGRSGAAALVAAAALVTVAGHHVEQDDAAARRLANRAVVPHLVAAEHLELDLSLESRGLKRLCGLLDRHPDDVRDGDLLGTGGDVHHHGLALLVQRTGRGLLRGDRALRVLAVLIRLLLQAGAVRGW